MYPQQGYKTTSYPDNYRAIDIQIIAIINLTAI